MNVIRREIEFLLKKWCYKSKILTIIGARQVGKTTLLERLFPEGAECLWLNADDSGDRLKLENPTLSQLKSLVGDYKMLIIDEIQRVVNIGLTLKLLADKFKHVQVIATGSSSIEISNQIFEPLTGRQILLHLYPFSLAELYKGKSQHQVEKELPFHLIYGSYPDVCNHRAEAERLIKNISENYLYKDILAWRDIKKPHLLEKLLRLLAFQVGSEASINELANQLQVKSETVLSYIDLLEKSFVIFQLKAYNNNPRKEVSKMSKIYFWDNGIRNAAIDDFSPVESRNDIGALWENLMISERLKMNLWKEYDPKIYFWRNYNQSEVDYIEVKNRKIWAYEMKWNTKTKNYVSKAFTNLYPHANTQVINPQNFYEFCKI